MKNICKARVRASYTVEAALIFPFIIYIIIALMYLSFYLHDIGKVQAIIDESQVKSKGLIRNEVDINRGIMSYHDYIDRTIFYPFEYDFESKERQIENYIYKRCQDKLFISKVSNVQVETGAFNVDINVDINFNFPFKMIESFFLGSEKVTINSIEDIHDPMNFIRAYEVAAKLGNKIDVDNQVVSKLKEIVNLMK